MKTNEGKKRNTVERSILLALLRSLEFTQNNLQKQDASEKPAIFSWLGVQP